MNNNKKDTYSYKGWLISDSFIKRSLASTGYHFVGTFFVYLAVIVIMLVIAGVALLAGNIFGKKFFPGETNVNFKTTQRNNINVNKYTGKIKEYTEGNHGDFLYYLEQTDGTKQGIKICNKRVESLNYQISSLAGAETQVGIYSNSGLNYGACVTGIVVNSENSQKYSGLIKKYAIDKTTDEFSYYIQQFDGKKIGITLCDKKLIGIWNQALAVSDKSLTADLYSDQSQGSAICVNGIVVNY